MLLPWIPHTLNYVWAVARQVLDGTIMSNGKIRGGRHVACRHLLGVGTGVGEGQWNPRAVTMPTLSTLMSSEVVVMTTPIARFMGPTGPRWAPHELCYLGTHKVGITTTLSFSGVAYVYNALNYLFINLVQIQCENENSAPSLMWFLSPYN